MVNQRSGSDTETLGSLLPNAPGCVLSAYLHWHKLHKCLINTLFNKHCLCNTSLPPKSKRKRCTHQRAHDLPTSSANRLERARIVRKKVFTKE